MKPLSAQHDDAPLAGELLEPGEAVIADGTEIDTFNLDGSFRALHRACVQGNATDQSQTGRWRINGNILTINMTAVNGEPRSYEDRYRIDAVDGKTQDYTLVANNFPYKSRKVDSKFQMPPCDLVS